MGWRCESTFQRACVVAPIDAFACNAVSRFTCYRRSSRRLGDDTRCNLLRLFMHTYIFYSTLGFVMSDYGVHVRLLRSELEQRVPVLRHGEGSRESARRAAGVCRSWGAPLCATTPSAGTVCRPLSQHPATSCLLAVQMYCSGTRIRPSLTGFNEYSEVSGCIGGRRGRGRLPDAGDSRVRRRLGSCSPP